MIAERENLCSLSKIRAVLTAINVLKRQVFYIEDWLETGEPASPEDSEKLFNGVNASIAELEEAFETDLEVLEMFEAEKWLEKQIEHGHSDDKIALEIINMAAWGKDVTKHAHVFISYLDDVERHFG